MLSFVALALQAAFTSTLHPSYLNNPNIRVPASSVIHWYDMSKPHTACLQWIGPDPRGNAHGAEAMNLSGPLVSQSPPGFHPADIRNAYNVTLNGAQAICVVDNGHLPTALSDFNTFAQQFGLPQETSTNPLAASNKVFQVVYDNGSLPASNVGTGWDGEEALDIEWAHAMAPNAKIYVVESATGDLVSDNPIAAALSNVKEISNSWYQPNEGAGAGELMFDRSFLTPGVIYLACDGDIGSLPGYPAESPNVIGVGGTSLQMNTGGTAVVSETAWNDSGGGPSQYEPRPTFQNVPSVAAQVGSMRGDPDLSAVADPATGVAVYSSSIGGWEVYGGTSVATPVVAAIINTTGTFYNNNQVEESLIYSLLGTSSFRDIVSGSTFPDPYTGVSYTAHLGWDFITGCGSPLNLSRTIISYKRAPDQASTLTGTFQSGNATSLALVDGSDYTVTGVPFSSLGSTADVRAHFTLPSGPPSMAAQATITVTAKATTSNVINEIFLYNAVTKNYDLLGTPVLLGTNQTFTVTLSQAQAAEYVDSSGNVVVLSRALLPQRNIVGSNAGFSYSVDQIQVTYGFFQANG